MRSLFLVLLLVAFAIASSAALSSGEERLTKVTASDFDGLADGDSLARKRRLRVDSTGIAEEEEERAFTLIIKLTNRFTKDPAKLEKIAKNKKYRQWLKEDENPITILTTLGLKTERRPALP
ncbi:hypothetical protein PHYSODRAFT_284461 [Phytophthora sojae]|uniref:RxLR effector protein n=2 Tax=Phytophthora sojae TaxID=67593 RepID=G4YJ97_PHYSP|nr:hypothetical protein PHYSODRAFT_284461 [Phytophthora sojae]AEK81049.1 Avh257 [Phytophthora sojae]AEK81050.1 Avh257 [Phytophthora sojae]AEK81051.1 Avh257 [Phytophthora sojae]EGZ29431.1 hypothetical protein PHYSODRAFT_284461 [Phytophthora sojae]|eukprot:XP_009516706.1 hypothetical protein PHYSODRAFT_284461 [Phytophthora sojae]